MLHIPKTKGVKFVGTISTLCGELKCFEVKHNLVTLQVLMSRDIDGDITWEHVSVKPLRKDRVPTYYEMTLVKQLFWDPEDEVIHFFPGSKSHVNFEENCLHLWRPTGVKLPWEENR